VFSTTVRGSNLKVPRGRTLSERESIKGPYGPYKDNVINNKGFAIGALKVKRMYFRKRKDLPMEWSKTVPGVKRRKKKKNGF